jgi:hypothetical protein
MQHFSQKILILYLHLYICCRPYQKLVMASKFKITDVKQWTIELLKLQGNTKLATELAEWTLPRFPINGHMVKSKGFTGMSSHFVDNFH